MSFPAAPSNGQYAVVNNIAYQFDSAKQAWVRVLAFANSITVNNVTVTNSLTGNLVYASGYYFANGAPFTSSNYGNTNVAAYLDPYFIYANANAAAQTAAFNTLDANVGAFELYANTTFTSYSNANVAAYLPTYTGNLNPGNVSATGYYFANGMPFVSGSTYSNVNVAAYITGNITTGNITAAGYYFANGAPFTGGGGTYGNVDVAAYLPTYTGDLFPGNITASGNIVGGGVRNTTGSTPPANPVPGDTWYDTDNDVLLRYVDDGDSKQWVDISGVVIASLGGGYRYTIDSVPPATATPGDNWYDTTTDILFRYVTDGTHSYWVDNSSIGIELQTYGNIEVAAYLLGNVTTGNVSAAGYYFANGAPFIGGSNYGDSNVAAYLGSYYTYANANAAAQSTSIDNINANLGAYQIWANTSISTLQSNVAFQANLIDVLTGNAATQGSLLDTLVANAVTQANTLTTLLSNAAAQEASLSTLVSNAASQQTVIDTLQSQIYSNTNVAAYLAGNVTVGNITVTGQVATTGKIYVSDDIVPTTSNTINIGSDTMRFGSLFLSGNTIYLGNTVITEDTQLGTITFIPPATVTNPNPTAVIFTSNGSISAAQTIGGNVTANTATPTFANLTTTAIYSTSYFYANGAAFVGGGGGTGLDNLDGGTPYSVYGGLTAIDGGGVV